MPRPDPLLLVTVLGLAGTGLLATTFPDEAFDPDDAARQTGRRVQATLVVTSADSGATWLRGEALAVRPAARDASLHPTPVPWLWFRPPDHAPAPGDMLTARVLVQRDPAGHVLVIDGPNAGSVRPGGIPLPVRWSDLIAHPETYESRPLLLRALHAGDALAAPAGDARCALATPSAPPSPPGTDPTLWPIRLERHHTPLGWRCHLEAPPP